MFLILDHKVNKIKLAPFQALDKIKSWCAYQERSQSETRRKIRSFGLSEEETESIIATLIEENFLNEERFATAFAGGRFRIKHWGKNKIRIELKKHQISAYCINKAIAAIADEDYDKALYATIEKKLRFQSSGDRRKKFYTTLNYAVSRGFESDLVTEKLNDILGKDTNYEFRT